MYNTTQLLYIIISFAFIIGILIASKFIKNQKYKDLFLKIWAMSTFVIHISVMWVEYLQKGQAAAQESVLFPIYFCNACMYLLMIVAFMKNKRSKAFYYLATFVAYGGFLGGFITTFESHYFAGNPVVFSWGNIKSMLSHTTMMVGCLYLFVGGYVKIKVSNLIPFAYGLLGCFVLGLFNNWLFTTVGIYNPNSMYLVKSAIEDVPLFTGYFIGGAMTVLVALFTIISEQFAFNKGDRWFNHLPKYFKKKEQVETAQIENIEVE